MYPTSRSRVLRAGIVVALSLSPALSSAQPPAAARPGAQAGAFGVLRWRSLGPLRGGRSIAAEGSVARPNEYYFGATGGGLWKTTDGGTTWRPVTDGQINTSSVGAIGIAPSNPDVVYIGMGETEIPSKEIGALVMEGLKALDPVAYVRFASVYRNFREAKDFEDFVGRLGVDRD